MTMAVVANNASTTSEEWPMFSDDCLQVQGLGLQSTLYIMWPGLVAASAALFLVARY